MTGSERSPGLSDEDRQRIAASAESDSPHADDLLPEGESMRAIGLNGDLDSTPDTEEAESAEDEENSEAASGDDDKDTSPTPTRERVLSGGEFERLLIGATRIDGDDGMEAWCAVVVMGRLGLRAGELAHLSSEWIDFRERILTIPAHDHCDRGRDGDLCGSCRQAVRQRQSHGDDRPLDEIAAEYWQPKTEAAARSVPFGWSDRAMEALTILTNRWGRWPHSYSTLKRRIKTAFANAPGLAQDAATLHGLRGTAASHHAGNGVNKEALKQMMGWRDDQTPQKYLKIDGKMTQRALAEVYE